ncbi:energy transducer TonB [Zoogloea sp.]|uniref:energy transducer TonB n=1 Tax=Zoogloea sp. TaxID=49181 RepID=UPI0035B4B677
MNTIPPAPSALHGPLGLALGASLGLHLVALAWQIHRPAAEAPPRPLEVVLQRQAAPQAVPPSRAEAQPTLREQLRERPQEHPPRTRPSPERASPEVLTRPATSTTPSTPTTPAAPSASPVPSAAPTLAQVAMPASATANPPAPQPPDNTAHEAPADPAALERYGRSLAELLAQQQQYPRMAALRGWEGEVRVRITIARKGNIVATDVIRSSGHDVLDRSAVQLVTQAGPLPRLPEALQNREIQVIVPVHYRLEKSS